MKTKGIILLLACTLSACGGGGGSSTPVSPTNPSPATFPLASAMSAFMQAGHDYTVSSVSGADTYVMQLSWKPGAQQTFEGNLSSTMVNSSIFKKNGVVISTDSSTSYFDVSPYKPWGSVGSDGSYEVAAGQQRLPTSATTGQSGAFDTLTTYASSAKTSILSTSTETWSLETDTATTAWGCINSTTKYTDGSPTVTGANCFKTDQSGNVSAMKLTVYVNGQSLTFQ